MIYLLLLLIIIVNGYSHTSVYKKNWEVKKNKNNMFYDPLTFGSSMENPCNQINSNKVYRDMINEKIICNGEHCQESQYKCKKRGDKDCFHVERIIDVNGEEYKNCDYECKNIAGNMVMAWGRWNSALEKLARNDYESSIREKEIVYGKDNVDKSRYWIEYCMKIKMITGNETDYDSDCDSVDICNCDTDSECGCDCDYDVDTGMEEYKIITIVMGIIMGILMIIIIFLTCVIYKWVNKIRIDNDMI